MNWRKKIKYSVVCFLLEKLRVALAVIGFHSFIFQICVSPSKQYREGKEFEKTKQVLGSGNSAGDIIIVKDKKTGKEHAQKTVSKNRPTPRIMVLAATGASPA